MGHAPTFQAKPPDTSHLRTTLRNSNEDAQIKRPWYILGSSVNSVICALVKRGVAAAVGAGREKHFFFFHAGTVQKLPITTDGTARGVLDDQGQKPVLFSGFPIPY